MGMTKAGEPNLLIFLRMNFFHLRIQMSKKGPIHVVNVSQNDDNQVQKYQVSDAHMM